MRAFAPLLLIAALLAGPLRAQEDDRSTLTAFLEDSFSDAGRQVVITGFAGALSSRASLQVMTIADAQGVWLTLTDVSLDWQRSALLRGEVVIDSLTAARIEMTRLPVTGTSTMPTPEAADFALPELPVSIDIGEIAAAEIVLGETVLGQPVIGSLRAALHLSAGEGAANLTISRSGDGPKGLISLRAAYANATAVLELDLRAEEGAGGIAVGLLGVPDAPSVLFTLAGAGPISDFAADIGLETDGVSRLAGSVTLAKADDGDSRFDAELRGNVAPLFLPGYADFFGPEVTLRAEGSRSPEGVLTLGDLSLQARALDVRGQVALSADGLPDRFDVTGRLGLADASPLLLPLPGAIATRITRADLALSYDRLAGEGWKGEVSLQGLDRADLSAASLRLSGSGRIARLASDAMVGATLKFGALGLMAADPGLQQALGQGVDGNLLGHWRASDGRVTISRLRVEAPGYVIQTTGNIGGLESGLALTGHTEATLADLSRFSTMTGYALGGAARLSVDGSGSPLSGQFDMAGSISGQDIVTGIAELDGFLRGATEMLIDARRDENGTTLRRLDLTAAGFTARTRGQLATAGSDLMADVDFADISVLGPAYHGALRGVASLHGTLDAASLRLTGTGTDLRIGQPQVDGLLAGATDLSFTADLSPVAANIRAAELTNSAVHLTASGSLGPTESDLAATMELYDLAVLGPGFGGALDGTARLTGGLQSGALTLRGAARNLSIGHALADPLLAGPSAVTLDIGYSADGITINNADLSNPQVTARADGIATADATTLHLSARLADLALLVPEFPGPLTVTGTAVQRPGGTELDLRAQGPGQIDTAITGTVAPDYATAALAFRGTAQAALINGLVAPRSVTGPTGFDLSLNGPFALASLSGNIALNGGRIADPGQSFGLDQVQATASLARGRAVVSVQARVSSGGSVAVAGTFGLAPPLPADLTIDLTNVILRDPQLYEAKLRGRLTLIGPALGGAEVAGRLDLLETELRIPSTGLGGPGDIPTLRHLHEPGEVRATRARAGLLNGPDGAGTSGNRSAVYRLNIRLDAPNRVFVRGRGLDAELGGTLMLTGTTAATVPGGSFELVRGRLDILGKRLNLTEALLQLQGNFDPYLRVLAATRNENFTSSVLIEGAAFNPTLSITSDPDLPDDEALAQLLFGQGLDTISPLQAAQLASAVATLAGRGGGGIIESLRKNTGLDNLDIRADDQGTAELTAGRYINSKVYTEVTVTQEGKSRIDLNLDLAPHVTLRGRADSDGSTGLGIFLQKDY